MKIILIVVLFLCFTYGNAQHTPHSLKEQMVLDELKNKTIFFDSIIVIDKSSYWRADAKIRGFGFKGSSLYKLDIFLKENDKAELQVSKLVKKKASKASKTQKLLKSNYPMLVDLHEDSLNLKPPRLTVTDDEIWSVLMMNHKNNITTLKQSFAPRVYQKTIPTRQRRLFIEFIDNVELVLK